MFGFPKVHKNEISEYKSSFLRSVIIQVKFNPNEKIVKDIDYISKLFKDTLPRFSNKDSQGLEISFQNHSTPVFKPIVTLNNAFELKSLDGHKLLGISQDSIDLTISGNIYKNFESLKEDISKINDIVIKNNIETVNRIAIRKLNIIDFNIGHAGFSPIEIVKHILNPSLVSGLSAFPNSEDINQNINTVNYSKGPHKLNFIYGLIKTNELDNSGQIVIDIDRFNEEELDSKRISEVFTQINDDIFNVFDWSICESAKKLLKQNS